MLKHAAKITAVLCAAALLQACDDRAPESALWGTWHIDVPQGIDTHNWLALSKDHKYVWFVTDGTRETINDRGTWYGGGKDLYMRRDEDGKKHVWKIVEILPSELRLRYGKQDYILKRDDQKSIPSI